MPENIPQISGILFAFADQVHAELGVPVGIVNRAIGGNPVRSFVDQAALPRPGCRPSWKS